MSDGEWQIEMTWRCSSCRHRNRGRDTVCVQCGSPKDGSEQYEMPEDTSAAQAVSDPALLRTAKAGPNWRCAYCQSDQRRPDGACARCGATRDAGTTVPLDGGVGTASPRGATVAPVRARGPRVSPRDTSRRAVGVTASSPSRVAAWLRAERSIGSSVAVALIAAAVLACVAGMLTVLLVVRPASSGGYGARGVSQMAPPPPPPPRVVDAVVESVAWEHVISVDRRRRVQHEGFAEQRPGDALQVESLGERLHHHERVPDGYNTERYDERVPDGYDTEYYSQRVVCGRDCDRTPRRCRSECRPNANGFASCRDVCTGGDETCRPRYCDERRSRQVPRSRTVQRERQVPRYRDEARNLPWYRWSVWEWGEVRSVRAAGQGFASRWPDAEARVGAALGPGEQERARRAAMYSAVLRYDTSRTFTAALGSEAEWRRFALGSHATLRVYRDGRAELAAPPTPEAAQSGAGAAGALDGAVQAAREDAGSALPGPQGDAAADAASASSP